MRLVTVNDLDKPQVPGLAQVLRSTNVCSDLRVTTVTAISLITGDSKEQAQSQFKVSPTNLNKVIKVLNANGYYTYDVSALLATTEDVPDELARETALFPGRVGGSRLSTLEMHTNISQGTSFTFDHGLLIVLSGFFAAYGLLMDSSVNILAAFFVSPLMNMIIVSAWGFVIRDYQLARQGLKNVMLGASFTWVIGAIVGLLMCQNFGLFDKDEKVGQMTINSIEILSRGPPVNVRWAGTAIIASLSGVTAALGQSTGVTSALAGVTLAASLLPPLVNSGMCTVLGLVHPYWRTANGDTLHAVAVASLGIYLITVPLIIFWAFLVFKFKHVGGRFFFVGRAANNEALGQVLVSRSSSRIAPHNRSELPPTPMSVRSLQQPDLRESLKRFSALEQTGGINTDAVWSAINRQIS